VADPEGDESGPDERDLEEQRLEGTFAEELRAARARAAASQRPNLVAVAPPEPEAAAEAPPLTRSRPRTCAKPIRRICSWSGNGA